MISLVKEMKVPSVVIFCLSLTCKFNTSGPRELYVLFVEWQIDDSRIDSLFCPSEAGLVWGDFRDNVNLEFSAKYFWR